MTTIVDWVVAPLFVIGFAVGFYWLLERATR